jgi:hypothetical protein
LYPEGKGRWSDTGDGVSGIRGSCMAMSLAGLCCRGTLECVL